MQSETEVPTVDLFSGFTPEEIRGMMSMGQGGYWKVYTPEKYEKRCGEMSIINRGRVTSQETRDLISKVRMGHEVTYETRCKISESKTGYIFGVDYRLKNSDAQRGKKLSQETKDKISKSKTGVRHTLEHRENESIAQTGRVVSVETRKKMSESQSRNWSNPEFNKKKRVSINNSASISPNQDESLLISFLETNFPGKWKFVGDGSFLVGSKNPDFIRVDGTPQIIEYFGSRYHDFPEEETRSEYFSNYGYSCLFIWSQDFWVDDSNLLIERIRTFMDSKEVSL